MASPSANLPNCKPRHPSLQNWWAEPRGGGTARNDRPSTRHLPGRRRRHCDRPSTRAPLAARQIAKSSMHPSGEIDLALALHDGLLAGGWFHATILQPSPASTMSRRTARPCRSTETATNSRHGRKAKDDKSKTEVTGFVAWIPLNESPGPLLQPRFQMRLASGAVRPLIPKPQPFEPATQRNHVLRAVPPQHAVDDAFRTILAPALQDVERRIGQNHRGRLHEGLRPASKARRSFRSSCPSTGSRFPAFSIVRDGHGSLARGECGDHLRPRFTGNPGRDEAPAGRAALLHGLPMKLVVMNRNGGYARACNAGARFARGTILVMLNSDVVPLRARLAPVLSRPLSGTTDTRRHRPETDLRRRIAAACRALFRPRPARDLAESPFPQGDARRLPAGAASPATFPASPAPAS